MRLLPFVLVTLVMKFSFCDIDIFNQCPDFQSMQNIDNEQLFGSWFAIEIVMHYVGNRPLMVPDNCVMINVDGTRKVVVQPQVPQSNVTVVPLLVTNKTSNGDYKNKTLVTQELKKDLRLNNKKIIKTVSFKKSIERPQKDVIEFNVQNLNETHHVFQQLNYTLKINNSKEGLWIRNENSNVQVVMFESNFTVLTLCDKTNLISFVLSRVNDLSETELSELKDVANWQLRRRGLTMQASIALCRCSMIFPCNVSALIAVVLIIKNMRA